jgi:plasmid maintenance system antidote protein VapI
MTEARRYRRVFRSSELSTLKIARALRLPSSSVEQLLAGKVRLLTVGQAERIEQLLSPPARAWVREGRRYDVGLQFVGRI